VHSNSMKPIRWNKEHSPVGRIDVRENADGTMDAHIFYHRNSLKFAAFTLQGTDDPVLSQDILDALVAEGFGRGPIFWKRDEETGEVFLELSGMDLSEAKAALARTKKVFPALGVLDVKTCKDGTCRITGFGAADAVEYLPYRIHRHLQSHLSGTDARVDFHVIEDPMDLGLDINIAALDEGERQQVEAGLRRAMAELNQDLQAREARLKADQKDPSKGIDGHPEIEKIKGSFFIRGFASNESRAAAKAYLSAALDKDTRAILARPGMMTDRDMENKLTPVIKVRGVANLEALESALQADGFIDPEHLEVQEVIDWKRPGRALELARERTAAAIKRDAERMTGRVYFWGGSVPNVISGLVRGNTGETFMGLAFAIPNFILGYMKGEPRDADKLEEDGRKVFTNKEGRLDLQQSVPYPQGPVRFGKMFDGFLNAMSGDEAPGHQEGKPTTRYGLKTLATLFAGAMSFKGGLEGKKVVVLDENLNPVLGEDGRPKYVTEKDGALLRSGVLITSAYAAPAFVPSDSETGPPLTDWEAAAEQVRQIPGGDAITKATKATGSFLRDKPIIKQYMDAAKENNVKVAGNMMSVHNLQQIGTALWQMGVSSPNEKKLYQMKMRQERQKFFGEQGRFTHNYLGPEGIFPQMSRLLDAEGDLTAEAVQAKNAVIRDYDALQQQRDRLAKKDKKGKRPEIQLEISRLEGEMDAMAARYERALLLGCYDLDDKTQRVGWRRQKVLGSADRLRAWHEEHYLDNPRQSIETGGDEETAYVAAISRQRYQQVVRQPFLAALRLQYSIANFAAAQIMKQINSSSTVVEQNTAEVYLDQKLLFEKFANIVADEIAERQKHREPVTYEHIQGSVKHLGEYLEKQREYDGLSQDKKNKQKVNVPNGILVRLIDMQESGKDARLATESGVPSIREAAPELNHIYELAKAEQENMRPSFDRRSVEAEDQRAFMTIESRGKALADQRIVSLFETAQPALAVA
jgi:hypothetical protein